MSFHCNVDEMLQETNSCLYQLTYRGNCCTFCLKLQNLSMMLGKDLLYVKVYDIPMYIYMSTHLCLYMSFMYMVLNLAFSLKDMTCRTFHMSMFRSTTICLIAAKYSMVCILLNLCSHLFMDIEVFPSPPFFAL